MATCQDEGHRGEARRVPIQSFAKGGRQFRGAVIVQQSKKLSREPSGRFAALERGLKKGLTFRDQRSQARRASGSQSLALLFEQRLAVGGIFDQFISIIGAAMG